MKARDELAYVKSHPNPKIRELYVRLAKLKLRGCTVEVEEIHEDGESPQGSVVPLNHEGQTISVSPGDVGPDQGSG